MPTPRKPMSLLLPILAALLPLRAAAAPASETPETPPPWTQLTGTLAFGGWPGALYVEADAERRMALHRSSSVAFQNTFVGVGGMVAWAPPFVRVGPRFSVSPIDVFVLDVQPAWCAYFGNNSSGLLPYDTLGGKLDLTREPRAGEAPFGQVWSLLVSPTFQVQLGPFIAVANPAFDFVRVIDGGDSPLVYDAMHDLLVSRADVELQAQYLAMIELGHADAALFRFGATLRHAEALVAGDRSIALGPILMLDPSPKPAFPLILAQGLVYVADADRVGTMPLLLAAVQWDVPVSKAKRTKAEALSNPGPLYTRRD